MIKPNIPAPKLEVSTLGETTWKLSEQQPEGFTLIVFYRGLHCPLCKKQLQELKDKLDDFRDQGVEVIAVSGDDRERAEQTQREWKLEGLRIGYGQTIESMREWGLFVSQAINEKEPSQFSEPGLFLIRPDGILYYAAIQSMPFARPPLDDLIGAIKFVRQNGYPARGES
jgi:peroxiredoxin